jgi:hypothetical protein
MTEKTMNKTRLYVLIRACYLREKLDTFIEEMFNKEIMSLSVDLLELVAHWIDTFDLDPDHILENEEDERESEATVEDKENIGEKENIDQKKKLAEKKNIGRTSGSVFF